MQQKKESRPKRQHNEAKKTKNKKKLQRIEGTAEREKEKKIQHMKATKINKEEIKNLKITKEL